MNDDVRIIMSYPSDKILEKILEHLDKRIVDKIRRDLKPRWQDSRDIWEYVPQELAERLFEYVEIRNVHQPSGSWAPEGNYRAKYYRCILCGKDVEGECLGGDIFNADDDLNGLKQHIVRTCPVVKELWESAPHFYDFLNSLEANKKEK